MMIFSQSVRLSEVIGHISSFVNQTKNYKKARQCLGASDGILTGCTYIDA